MGLVLVNPSYLHFETADVNSKYNKTKANKEHTRLKYYNVFGDMCFVIYLKLSSRPIATSLERETHQYLGTKV